MNETVLTIDEAARCLPDLADRVHATGESALLLKAGKPYVRIEPASVSKESPEELIAVLHRWRLEHPEPDEQFVEAIEESRKAVQAPRDPGRLR